MYNKDVKDRYLEYVGNDSYAKQVNTISAFKKMEIFESSYKKDICNFNAAEIDNAYRTLNLKMVTAVRNLNSILLKYTSWCQQEALVVDGINHYEEFYGKRMDVYVDNGYVSDGYLTREEILNIADDMLNPMDAFALVAIYEGFSGTGREDFTYATIDDFDGNTINLRNRTMEVSDEFIALAHKSNRQSTYMSRRSASFDTELVGNSRLIYKPVEGKPLPKSPDRTIMARLKSELQALGYDELTLQDVTLFGRIHFIKTKAAEFNVSPRELCLRHTDLLVQQFNLSAEYANSILYERIKKFLV